MLVGLYVEEIWRTFPKYARFTLLDLDEIEPGLAGYFSKWIDRQKRKWESNSRFEDDVLTRPLLTALALLGQARGPLLDRELKAPRYAEIPPRSQTSGAACSGVVRVCPSSVLRYQAAASIN